MSVPKRATVYFEPEIHRALRLKAAATDRSISGMVNDAVKLALAEDAEDLAVLSRIQLLKYSEESRAFDNFYADFSNGKRSFRIVRDRSQLMLEGNKAESEPYGRWQLSIFGSKSVPLLPKKYLIPRAQDFQISLAYVFNRNRHRLVHFHEVFLIHLIKQCK